MNRHLSIWLLTCSNLFEQKKRRRWITVLKHTKAGVRAKRKSILVRNPQTITHLLKAPKAGKPQESLD
jgi:hypothetical protein